MIRRGQMYYIIDKYDSVGSEQHAGRPAIVVSNDICNARSPVVEVVFLTTQPKQDMPTHVTLRSTAKISTALCEQITSVAAERVGDYFGECTEEEMSAIDTALRVSLALDIRPTTPVRRAVTITRPASEPSEAEAKLAAVIAERDLYKTLYDEIMNKILGR